jgi:hypothetical protein
MLTPKDGWKEDDVLSLPLDENDAFERKGARLLDLTLPGTNENEVRNELAKQLSAFANTGGGHIIYGIDDRGNVEGIARTLRGRQSTKDWLESVIPTLTDYEIVGVNVHEVPPNQSGSSLAADKSLYVVDVPDSDRAPHQSKNDYRYYVRLGGKSQPAPHRLVEDIRNRFRHPTIEVYGLTTLSAVSIAGIGRVVGLKSEFQMGLSISFGIRNTGRVRALNTCVQLSCHTSSGPVPLSMQVVSDEYFPRPSADANVLLEMKNPLYPGIAILARGLLHIPAAVEVHNHGNSLTFGWEAPSDVSLAITTFSDNAPANRQDFKMSDIDPAGHFSHVINEQVSRIKTGG